MIKFTLPRSKQYLSPVGDSIRHAMGYAGLTTQELPAKTGISAQRINKILNEGSCIAAQEVEKISSTLGGSKEFWLARSNNYRKRLKQTKGG